MKTAYKALLPALILLPAAATAQEQLTKEIDVEREIVPELRAASRMEVFPATVRPTMKTVRLTPGELTSPTDYQLLTFRYEPASAGAAAPLTPYRGYVDAGYFPVGDFGVAAGFAAVARENTTLNVWANLNRRQYDDKRGNSPDNTNSPFDYKVFDVAAGVDFAHRFSPKGKLGISTDFSYSSFNKALIHWIDYFTYEDPAQNVLRWNLDADWQGAADNGLVYNIGVFGGIFNFSKELPERMGIDELWYLKDKDSPQRQTTFGARVGARLPINASSDFGMDITTDWQRLKVVWTPHKHFISYYNQWTDWVEESKTFSVSSFTPYYNFRNEKFDIHAGVRLDLMTGNSTDFRVAPDVKLAYNPVAQFGIWLNATGGGKLNYLQSIYALSRYMLPSVTVRSTSDVKLDGEFGLRVGPFKGIALQGGVAYANAHDWLVPVHDRIFESRNLHAFKVFVGLTAAWRDYVSLTARYDRRLGDGWDNFWYAWRDDTRSAVSASLAVRPFAPLEITAGYTGRFERYHGDISTLSAGATYRITAPLSVFAKFDNILNRTQYDVVGFQTPGFNGLFGVEYKF